MRLSVGLGGSTMLLAKALGLNRHLVNRPLVVAPPWSNMFWCTSCVSSQSNNAIHIFLYLSCVGVLLHKNIFVFKP